MDQNNNKDDKKQPKSVEGDLSDDITVEADENLDDSVVAEESLQETVKKLREKLKKAQTEKQEYLLGWQKERADFQNFKKKINEEMSEFRKFAAEGFVEELLPVLQSFEMAFSNKEAWEKADKNWRTGIEYIHSQLVKVLEDQGVKEIAPVGEKFDSSKHEIAEMIQVEDESDHHKIIEVVQKGYSLNGKILRAPKVKIGELKKTPSNLS
ncbi:MAG: nucleotide exchange factor GrpE [Candidatus Paceibacterota bacterium]|jgi:molecular chaperone GrpE